ncbi:MAG: lipid II:glycine glycyltransferase FemX [Candidatus Hodarchaeota archaeon]
MRFIKLTPDLSKEWDKIVHASDDAWLFHLYDWLPFTEKVWNLESKSFLVEHEGEIIAIFPLQMHKKTKIFRSTFMGTGGAAIKNSIHPIFCKKVFKQMYRLVEAIAHKNESPYIEIYLPPLANSSLNNRWKVNSLISYFFTDTSTHTWIVDLTKPDDIIFRNLTKDARRSIKKAKDAGYQIQKLRSIDEIDEYYKVHCETYHRTGVHPHPKEYFLGIYNNFCKKGYATIWKALDQDGEPIAFENIGLFKSGAIYWTGCCKTEHLDSGVNYSLQYNSMLWAKSQGAEWFENGEAFPNIREGKLRGLTVFKGKFGGELHRFYKGKLVLKSETTSRKKFMRLTSGLLRKIWPE